MSKSPSQIRNLAQVQMALIAGSQYTSIHKSKQLYSDQTPRRSESVTKADKTSAHARGNVAMSGFWTSAPGFRSRAFGLWLQGEGWYGSGP